MLSDSAFGRLKDIRENVRLAREFVGDFSLVDFEADRRTVYAVSRCLEIVSEAARRVPREVRDRHPRLPWRAIFDPGNVYRHEYHNVVEERIWQTVHESLPSILEFADLEIAGAEADDPASR
jgi:uncharacterized protein with HEPN domain